VKVGAAEEAESIGQNLERALTEHQPVELDPFFQDPEHEVLLLGPRHVAELLLAGQIDELLHRHLLERRDVGVALLEGLVVARHVEPVPDLLGDLLGEAHRLAFGVGIDGGLLGGGIAHDIPLMPRGGQPGTDTTDETGTNESGRRWPDRFLRGCRMHPTTEHVAVERNPRREPIDVAITASAQGGRGDPRSDRLGSEYMPGGPKHPRGLFF